MAKPIAFVVMPFALKPTGSTGPLPAEIDFDAVWAKVYEPVLKALGYKPVRADCDVGALIITEMIQRLTLADLVVADVTLPNANVYYEIGVRHAASKRGCVLTAVEGTKPLFDMAQMRRLTYPLADGAVSDGAAAAAQVVLKGGLGELADGLSPVFAAVPGFPEDRDPTRLSAFEDFVKELSAFQAAARAARQAPKAQQKALAKALMDDYGENRPVVESVALEILRLVRDLVGWKEMAEYAAALPENVRRHPLVREQVYLAMGKSKDIAAVGHLEQLIADLGETSERRGLLGGRFKDLWRDATDKAEKARFLNRAIEQYELGMRADLNNYYPSSNLPRLYRARGKEGDAKKRSDAAVIALAACHRALDLGRDDGWVRPTLLGIAFEVGDVREAQRLGEEVRLAGAAAWQLESTIGDLRLSVQQQQDPRIKAELSDVLAGLEEVLNP